MISIKLNHRSVSQDEYVMQPGVTRVLGYSNLGLHGCLVTVTWGYKGPSSISLWPLRIPVLRKVFSCSKRGYPFNRPRGCDKGSRFSRDYVLPAVGSNFPFQYIKEKNGFSESYFHPFLADGWFVHSRAAREPRQHETALSTVLQLPPCRAL